MVRDGGANAWTNSCNVFVLDKLVQIGQVSSFTWVVPGSFSHLDRCSANRGDGQMFVQMDEKQILVQMGPFLFLYLGLGMANSPFGRVLLLGGDGRRS